MNMIHFPRCHRDISHSQNMDQLLHQDTLEHGSLLQDVRYSKDYTSMRHPLW